MGDQLLYRLPFEEVVEKFGCFQKVPFGELHSGFIVSTFNKDEAFLFEEGVESNSTNKLDPETPICYEKSEYMEIGTEFIAEIQTRKLSKAIFSRIKQVSLEIEPRIAFKALCEKYPNAFVYLISSEFFGTWIGATPETLIACNRDSGHTVALAGTLKSSDQTPWGEKERLEQQYVTDFIHGKLTELGISEIKMDGPHDRIAGPVKHLETSFQFSMHGQTPRNIAEKIHPTPAVSGLPQTEALNLISMHERHNRQLYAGCIGILGERTDLFVNLRCAQIIGKEVYLYVGGGFTKDSIVEKEWQETENKSRTLLDVLENL